MARLRARVERVLERIHALVGDAEHIRGGASVVRQQRRSVAGCHGEPVPLFHQRGRGEIGELTGVAVGLEQNRKLVSVEAIGAAASVHNPRELLSQALEQSVPGQVAVGVVVLLEANEIEQDEQHGAIRAGRGEGLLEIGQEPRASEKSGQIIGVAFAAHAAPAHEPHCHERRGDREHDPGRIHELHSVAEPAQAVTDRAERNCGDR